MNIRDLHYLAAIAEHRHFGKAALACHVSQPTLSMQLKKLEEYLGVVLIERGKGSLLLTPVGESVLAHAQHILRHSAAIREVAKLSHDPLAGEFRLGIFPTLAPYLLPHIMLNMQQALPKLTPLLIEEKTANLLEMLKNGQLDAALLALPIDDDALATELLFDEPFMLAVPAAHPLAAHASVSYADILGEPLLLLEDGHCLRAQALEICRLSGAAEHQQFRATSLETLRHMVAAGVGITVIPALAVQPNDRIAYVPFAPEQVTRHVGMVWRRQSPRAEATQRIGAIIQGSVYL